MINLQIGVYKKVTKKKFVEKINMLYFILNAIFIVILIYKDWWRFYKDENFIELYSLIFPYILISFICIYLPIYFLLELGRTNDIFPKTYLFVFCIQLIEIVFYILLLLNILGIVLILIYIYL